MSLVQSKQHGHTFSVYSYPLSVWLTLPWGVLSTSWCCPSRLCVVFLACMYLALFLPLSLSPGNSLVSSWCDHSRLASLLWWCLTVPSIPALWRTYSFVFFAVHETCRIFLSFHLMWGHKIWHHHIDMTEQCCEDQNCHCQGQTPRPVVLRRPEVVLRHLPRPEHNNTALNHRSLQRIVFR